MLTKKRITAAVVIVLLLFFAIVATIPRPANYKGDNPMQKKGELPILIAHGGGNKEFPDNTLEAFYNAFSVDKNVMMETDVSITKDGVVILSHDTTIDRKTNKTGAIADWNYTDLISERVDFGYTNPTKNETLTGDRVKFKNELGKEVTPLDVTYPEGVTARDEEVFLATTLEELILAFPDNRINVEIKQEGELGLRALEATLDILERTDSFDRVVLASFHSEIYDELVSLAKSDDVPEGFLFSPSISGVVKYYLLNTFGLDVFFTDPIAVFQLPTEEYGITLAKRSLINSAKRHNIAVHYWTINDKDEMRELIDLGADGIMTDYPHRLAEVYAEYGND